MKVHLQCGGESGSRMGKIFSFFRDFLIWGNALAVLCLFLPTQSLGGELRPYDLPSQKLDPRLYQQQPQYQQTVDESVYVNFANQIRTLDQAKKNELIKTFSQKRDEAITNGRLEEAKHYNRLLDILKPKK